MAERPVACTLSPSERAGRRAGLVAALGGELREVRWLPDGVALRCVAGPGGLARLGAFIEAERRCCAFLAFRLSVEPGDGAVWLELTGPPGTREFLAAELVGAAPGPA